MADNTIGAVTVWIFGGKFKAQILGYQQLFVSRSHNRGGVCIQFIKVAGQDVHCIYYLSIRNIFVSSLMQYMKYNGDGIIAAAAEL